MAVDSAMLKEQCKTISSGMRSERGQLPRYDTLDEQYFTVAMRDAALEASKAVDEARRQFDIAWTQQEIDRLQRAMDKHKAFQDGLRKAAAQDLVE